MLSAIPIFAVLSIFLYDGVRAQDAPVMASSSMVGHVTVIQRDVNDNIKSYSQSDNIIVNGGENCMAKLLFQDATGAAGNTVCTGANTVGWRYIGLEESASAVAADDATWNDPADSAGLSTPLWSHATWTNSTGTGGTSRSVVALAATFTNSGASETIQGAALFNGTTATKGMLAHTLFASPAVVDTSDTLTVTWTITVGGGTVD
jgi:hypothetical protein